ncbi:MAG TPA: helix-turn-helix domain-containing protein, partial [Thermomicrobiales bacterium]|nr:helix-turn-helix domain-containing protein [Thermomicrobiales bacterium]
MSAVGTMEPSAFGVWLRHRREMAGITQEELAARAGLTARGIAAIERGRSQRPYPHTVRALASALALSADERSDLLAMISTPVTRSDSVESLAIPILHSPPTHLIGRDTALSEVQAMLLAPNARLVTLTGPGGVGKTSLALEVVRRVTEAVPDGVVVVPCESLDDPTLLLSWIATRVGITGIAKGEEVTALHGYFQGRQPLLLLDNLEHLLPAAADVAALLAANPDLRVLVTSRAPLRLRGEHEYQVGPLTLPDLTHIPTPEEVGGSGAVQLFVERAQASCQTFHLTHTNTMAVAAICRRLDGLPLALELAAARLRILSPTELLARLDQSLPVLTGGARDLPERQRTIRQTIEWSHRLLSFEEQALFRHLSVFVGGWDSAAAEEIGAGAVADSSLDVLSRLVEHSLVQVERNGADSTRYRMLETIREFGRDQLHTHGDMQNAARAHAFWFQKVAEQAVAHYYGPDEADWLDRLELDHPNLRAAVVHAIHDEDQTLLLRLVAALGRLWNKREHFGEGRAWMERVLDIVHQSGPSPEGATVLFNIGRLTWDQGDKATGIALLRESLAAWNALEIIRDACSASVILANMLRLTGETPEALTLLSEARLSLEQLGDEPFWLSTNLRLLGIMALETEDWLNAEALLVQALAAARESRYPWAVASALHNLAHLLHLRHNHELALQRFLESLQISLDERDYWPLAVTFPPVAEVLVSLGEHEQAARLFGAASSLSEMMVTRLSATTPVVESHERAHAAARDALGEARFDLLWNA